jgi:3-deoxy-manno-octulosonate cytidylyltransferase (CMP-KDO synthetase)
MNTKIAGVIPARYKSSRLPGKPLVLLLGKPMVIWVLELTSQILGKENTYVATDDNKILSVVHDYGFQAVMTSENHLTGTDRLSEFATKVSADIYINVQGDEPTLNPLSIQKVIDEKMRFPGEVINAMSELGKDENPSSVNIPKVITAPDNRMIYMSRLAIPGYKDENSKPEKYYKQVCIYAFNREELLAYGRHGKKGMQEQHEDIEILRFQDLNIPVRMVEVEGKTYAVDIPEDVAVVEKRLKEIHGL